MEMKNKQTNNSLSPSLRRANQLNPISVKRTDSRSVKRKEKEKRKQIFRKRRRNVVSFDSRMKKILYND